MISYNPQTPSSSFRTHEHLTIQNTSLKRKPSQSDQKTKQIGIEFIDNSTLSEPILSDPEDIITNLRFEKRRIEKMAHKLNIQTKGLSGIYNKIFNYSTSCDTKLKLNHFSKNLSVIEQDIDNLKNHNTEIKREQYLHLLKYEIASILLTLDDLESVENIFKKRAAS